MLSVKLNIFSVMANICNRNQGSLSDILLKMKITKGPLLTSLVLFGQVMF